MKAATVHAPEQSPAVSPALRRCACGTTVVPPTTSTTTTLPNTQPNLLQFNLFP